MMTIVRGLIFTTLCLFLFMSFDMKEANAACGYTANYDYICDVGTIPNINGYVPSPPPTTLPPGGCNQIAYGWNWSAPPSLTTMTTPEGCTISSPFLTTDHPDFGGVFTFEDAPGSSGAQRLVWVSLTPNGPPLSSQCSSSGTGMTDVTWAQKNTPGSPYFCVLNLETAYYLNVKVAICPSGPNGCNTDRSLLTNGMFFLP